MPKRLLRYDTVTLPSGAKIRGVLPTAQELTRRGLWPSDLRVQMFLAGVGVQEDEDNSVRQKYVESQHITIACYIRQEWDTETGAWERVEYSPAEVHDFAPEDLDALEDIVLRRKTAAQVTAETLEAAGEMTEEDRSTVEEKEAADTVTGWAGFRDDADSVTPGSDSGDVEDAAVGTAAGGGRRARAGAGRGTRHPAGEG